MYMYFFVGFCVNVYRILCIHVPPVCMHCKLYKYM